ncbi:MAG: dockerin type I repeat-containing protein [Candidatus Zixiibacteriota bacterium]
MYGALRKRLLPAAMIVIVSLAPMIAFAAGQPIKKQQLKVSSASDAGKPVQSTASASKGETIGYTYYDLQANYSVPRLIEHGGTDRLHFVWTVSNDTLENFPNRDIRYSAWDLNGCFQLFTAGLDIAYPKTGFAALDLYQSSYFPVIAGNLSDNTSYRSAAFYDFAYGLESDPIGLFTDDSPTDIYGHAYPGQEGTGPDNPNLWPQIEMQFGTETVLHMVTTEKSPNYLVTASYYRRVGPYGAGNGVWSDQRIIDTVTRATPTVIADPNSDKVAIAWIAPCEWYRPDEELQAPELDVYYAESFVQGADWVSASPGPSISHEIELGTLSGGNASNYEKPGSLAGLEFAYNEVKGLYDQNGELHLIWNTRRFFNDYSTYQRFCSVQHWSQSAGIRTVYSTPYLRTRENDTCVFPGTNRKDAAYLSLAECANGNIYAAFTLFAPPELYYDGFEGPYYGSPCVQYDISSDDKNAVGYLYMAVSDNGGLYWDRPRQITDNPFPINGCSNCMCGFPQCHSEEYMSMTRYSRTETCGENTGLDVLDIFFIDDLAPGPLTANALKYNPVVWTTTPCRNMSYEFNCVQDNVGEGLGLCYPANPIFVSNVHPTTTFDYKLYPGLLEYNYAIEIEYTIGEDWLTPSSTSGIVAVDDTAEVELLFSTPSGAIPGVVWEAVMSVYAWNESDSCRKDIPVCLWYAIVDPEMDEVLATTCKQLKINNCGNAGMNKANYTLDYIDDCDTFSAYTDPELYLYLSTPLVGRIENGDTLLFHMYHSYWTAESGFWPVASIEIDSISDPNMTTARTEFETRDGSIGCILEYYVPTHPDTCEGMVQRYRFYNNTDAELTNVVLGCLFDWDVPSDSGMDNTSAFDVGQKTIWQQGYEYDNVTNGDCGQLENDRFAGISSLNFIPQNAQTIDNATYVYTSGPYGTDAPLPPGPMYQLMAGEEGYSTYHSSHPDSMAVDLSTLITFDAVSLGVGDTLEYVQIIATGKSGQAGFGADLDNLREWATRWEVDCCVVPGDANYDGVFNIGDAVYLIGYIFKGGPQPPCLNAADANRDCSINIGDAVYMISNIFKGGPPPQCGCVN